MERRRQLENSLRLAQLTLRRHKLRDADKLRGK
jgi:hypothetical protein